MEPTTHTGSTAYPAGGATNSNDSRRVLAERDDRAWLQSRARADLVTSGQTVDRLSVARRATRLAEQTEQGARQQRAG